MNFHQFALTLLLVTASSLACADVVVVVSAKSPVSQVSKDQLAGIYLAKSSTFPGGVEAVPVNQSEGAHAREEFQSKVIGKSDAQLKSYWTALVFSGKGVPPKEVANSAEVKKLVSVNPNMVGYIDKSDVDGSVKVILAP